MSSEFDFDIGRHIEQILSCNSTEIQNIVDSGSGDSGESFMFKTEVDGVFEEVEYTFRFKVSYRDEEPHSFQIEDGRYSVTIVCRMDDTSVLTDLKEEMYILSSRYVPYEDHVTQDYPSGKLKISHDMTEEHFKESFIV